jgi:hypothetical protein
MASLKEAIKIFSESGSEKAIFWKEGRGWKSAVYPIPCFPRESAEKIIQADPNAIVSYLYGSMADTELQIKQNYGREEYLLSAKLAEIEAVPPVFKWEVSCNVESYNCCRQTRPLRRGEPEHTGVFEFAGVFDTREEALEYVLKLNSGDMSAEEVREESAEKRRQARIKDEEAVTPVFEENKTKRQEAASVPLPAEKAASLPEAIEKVWTRLMCDGDFRKLAGSTETWRKMLETRGLFERVKQAASEAGVYEWYERDSGEILDEVKRRVYKTLREKRKAEENSGLPKLTVNADELIKGIAEMAGAAGHKEVGSIISGYEIVAAGKRACAGRNAEEGSGFLAGHQPPKNAERGEPYVCWKYDERGGVWGGSYFNTLKRALKEFISLEIAAVKEAAFSAGISAEKTLSRSP